VPGTAAHGRCSAPGRAQSKPPAFRGPRGGTKRARGPCCTGDAGWWSGVGGLHIPRWWWGGSLGQGAACWVRVRLSCSPDHFLPHLGNLDFLLPFVPYFSLVKPSLDLLETAARAGEGLRLFLLFPRQSRHRLSGTRPGKALTARGCSGAAAAAFGPGFPCERGSSCPPSASRLGVCAGCPPRASHGRLASIPLLRRAVKLLLNPPARPTLSPSSFSLRALTLSGPRRDPPLRLGGSAGRKQRFPPGWRGAKTALCQQTNTSPPPCFGLGGWGFCFLCFSRNSCGSRVQSSSCAVKGREFPKYGVAACGCRFPRVVGPNRAPATSLLPSPHPAAVTPVPGWGEVGTRGGLG